jgi:hypothetical protein
MHPMRASLFWARAVRAIDRCLVAAPNDQTPRAHLTQDSREPQSGHARDNEAHGQMGMAVGRSAGAALALRTSEESPWA